MSTTGRGSSHLLGTLLTVVLAVGTGAIAAPAVAVDAPAFCTAYAALQENPTDAQVIRAQAARMKKAKPPKDVAKALAVIRAAAAGTRAADDRATVNATSTISRYVGEQCAASSAGSGSGSSSRRCPLTNEQVTAAIGRPLEDAGSCSFFPPTGASPRVGFVRPGATVCAGTNPAALGFSEPYDGLPVKAYVQRSGDIAALLVCTEDPFDLRVEVPGDGTAALAVARRLATEVLAGS